MDNNFPKPNRHLPSQDASRLRRAPALGVVCMMLCAFSGFDAEAETIYRTEGDDGTVIFTDTLPPSQQGEPVELSPTNTQPRLVAPRPPQVADKPPSSQPTAYTRVTLVQPTNDLTIPTGQLDLVVQVALEPALREGHLVQFFMDGEAQGEPLAATSISIGDLFRGAHTIHAQVVDNNNRVIASTGTATIHVKRHSIQHKQ